MTNSIEDLDIGHAKVVFKKTFAIYGDVEIMGDIVRVSIPNSSDMFFKKSDLLLIEKAERVVAEGSE